jgi:hypothetical protein
MLARLRETASSSTSESEFASSIQWASERQRTPVVGVSGARIEFRSVFAHAAIVAAEEECETVNDDTGDGESTGQNETVIGQIHSFDSFGRALIDLAVEEANQKVGAGEADQAAESIELTFTVQVKRQHSSGARAADGFCCVCYRSPSGTVVCKGKCCF